MHLSMSKETILAAAVGFILGGLTLVSISSRAGDMFGSGDPGMDAIYRAQQNVYQMQHLEQMKEQSRALRNMSCP